MPIPKTVGPRALERLPSKGAKGIASACRARRSGVQPFAIACPQKFGFRGIGFARARARARAFGSSKPRG